MITRLIAALTLAIAAPGTTEPLPPMPAPHSNNAVAAVGVGGDIRLFSFMGLTEGKTYADISRQAYQLDWRTRQWTRVPDVPVPTGRLASTAASVGGKIYLFGGYSVAANGDEKSTPEVLSFDPVTWRYAQRSPMPVPVDDSVALPYADRYIYLVSGWHDTGNSALVQVYDTVEDRWARATDWPGTPVFGQAGGISGNRLVVVDGVAATRDPSTGRNRFAMSDEAWMGTIDPADPLKIAWRKLPAHPGEARYRMAAAGMGARIVFAGGSPVAYNYNGQGYDGAPAPASAGVFVFDFSSDCWRQLADKPVPTMDHRGLLDIGGTLYSVGGMDSERRVTGALVPVELTR